jgi:uncharacterized protein YdhG (YjbR/CyaY superfamily)
MQMPDTQKSAKKTTKTDRTAALSDEELAALKETVQERKAGKGGGEEAVLAKIAEMPGPDRVIAQRIHEIVKASAPTLSPKTWYGMPAYANEGGKVVCFFTAADKFKSRYATFGFEEAAKLDEGAMWPTSFAVTELTDAVEDKIAALVKKAVS